MAAFFFIQRTLQGLDGELHGGDLLADGEKLLGTDVLDLAGKLRGDFEVRRLCKLGGLLSFYVELVSYEEMKQRVLTLMSFAEVRLSAPLEC